MVARRPRSWKPYYMSLPILPQLGSHSFTSTTQSGGRKRVVSSCIPCYRKKQKVRVSLLVQWNHTYKVHTDYAKMWLTWLSGLRSATVAILATTALDAASPRNASTIPCKLRRLSRRRTAHPKTLRRTMMPSRKTLAATTSPSARRTGARGGTRRSPRGATHWPSCLDMSSIASPTPWPLCVG